MRTRQIERNLLRAQMQGALPYHYSTQELEGAVDHTAFEGTTDRIRFVSRTGITDGPEGLPRWVELRTERSVSGAAAVLEERRILSPNDQPSGDVLAKAPIADCNGMKFEYLENSGEKPQWRSAWPTATFSSPLPSAVRIECMTGSGSMQFLIPLDYAESARAGMLLR